MEANLKNGNSSSDEAYLMAQTAIAQLKAAVHQVLRAAAPESLRNADIGRALGIYTGHVEHEGHISRTLLAIMEAEGVVEQDKSTKLWSLRQFPENE
ncbi:MAG: hypothetical protein HQ513_14525 [Rhodospirillales bacterium]|nr:hypothetical protein [Rhodospirillales bacterium]